MNRPSPAGPSSPRFGQHPVPTAPASHLPPETQQTGWEAPQESSLGKHSSASLTATNVKVENQLLAPIKIHAVIRNAEPANFRRRAAGEACPAQTRGPSPARHHHQDSTKHLARVTPRRPSQGKATLQGHPGAEDVPSALALLPTAPLDQRSPPLIPYTGPPRVAKPTRGRDPMPSTLLL